MQLLEDPRTSRDDQKAAVRQAVRQAIDEMSERFQQPLVLRYLNGLTNRQIADVLGISVSNVKVRLARAKDVLQSRLAEVRD
jgi:RNA polymerase sigma-70 factor (ECF subfamily)